jgi:5-methylcytosine-specific restriction endonuclease McrA
MKVLVLNSDYIPINITNLKRGFRLVLNGKAEVVSELDEPLVSATKTFRKPIVIRLYKYVYIPFRKVQLNRYNIYKRDGHKCVYCGSKKDLTLDHVTPKSKGGKNTWKNLVTCCGSCNVKKGDRRPSECGMVMSIKPHKPGFFTFINNFSGKVHESWRPYIFS